MPCRPFRRLTDTGDTTLSKRAIPVSRQQPSNKNNQFIQVCAIYILLSFIQTTVAVRSNALNGLAAKVQSQKSVHLFIMANSLYTLKKYTANSQPSVYALKYR